MNIRDSFHYLFEDRVSGTEAVKFAKFFEYKADKAAEKDDDIEICYRTAAAALFIVSLIFSSMEFDEMMDYMTEDLDES